MTDSQLLGQYVADRDEMAFRSLVARHGPTVLRACRRVLDDPHEVEDAFQATFLVLLRKAPTIRDPEAIGGWLRGVARRVASRARRGAARRRHYESRSASMQPAFDATEPTWDDLCQVVREELDRLPDPYRVPLELCYLRGLGHEEAASELGWPLGTLKTRLVRGRRRLRERLDRRRVALGIGLLLLLLPRRSAAIPAALEEATVLAMRLDAAGELGPNDPRFGGASRLAGEYLESAAGPGWPWLLALLLLLASSLAATGYAAGLGPGGAKGLASILIGPGAAGPGPETGPEGGPPGAPAAAAGGCH